MNLEILYDDGSLEVICDIEYILFSDNEIDGQMICFFNDESGYGEARNANRVSRIRFMKE